MKWLAKSYRAADLVLFRLQFRSARLNRIAHGWAANARIAAIWCQNGRAAAYNRKWRAFCARLSDNMEGRGV